MGELPDNSSGVGSKAEERALALNPIGAYTPPPSKYFQSIRLEGVSDLTHSYTAKTHNLQNLIDSKEAENNLNSLYNSVLLPLKKKFGNVQIVSGYRSKKLNEIINGAQESQHQKGEAVDFYIPGYSLYDVTKWIRNNLDYDQLIIEEPSVGKQSWLHVSYTTKRKNRKMALIMSGGKYFADAENIYKYAGSVVYKEPFLPDDVDTTTLRALLYAISKTESKHGTLPFGKETWYLGTVDRALGFYHVMGNNVATWSKLYLGRKLTKEQFLNSPEYQHVIVARKFKKELDSQLKRGYSTNIAIKRVISKHFSGKWDYTAKTRDVNGTSTKTYTDIVYGNYVSYVKNNVPKS